MRPKPYSYERSFTRDSLRGAACFGTLRRVYRFDGINKRRLIWDGLRKDPELWSKGGDCTVHFYSPHSSKRGPSLRVPFRVIEQTNSRYLLQHCLHRADPTTPITDDDDHSDSGYGGSVSSDEALHCVELYISAPAHATKHEAHIFHISTRNYFAYLLDAPLVGETLGTALVGLWGRLQLWQPNDMIASDFRVYCQEQGYLSYSENPDYALASLYFCEQTKRKDIWADAFAHCTGMYDRLHASDEFLNLSTTSRALLSAASLRMEQHITQSVQSLGTFLEEDLGLTHLGLSKPLRDHLDLYRSTLQSFYVNRVGYWPPEDTGLLDKRLWRGMYNDFRSLYEYLVDNSSSNDKAENKADGGVCVMQNLHIFDERHDFAHLPHPLPLLPEQPVRKRSFDAHKGLKSLKLGLPNNSVEPRGALTPAQALKKASNSHKPEVVNNRLVQEYMRFERAKLEEKTTIVEARKVRFMLVYSILQTLISITRAPAEVRDAETPSYPLCVQSTRCPPWMDNTPVFREPNPPIEVADAYLPAELADTSATAEEDRKSICISIHPDFEAENASDYFSSMNSISRSGSDMSLSSMAPPARRSSQLGRRESIKSGVTSLHRSVVGSIIRNQRRGSLIPSRRNSTTSSAPSGSAIFSSYQEIMIDGYGNGSNASNAPQVYLPISARKSEESVRTITPELPTNSMSTIPTLEMHQISLAEGVKRPGGPVDALKALESTDTPFSQFEFNFSDQQNPTQKHSTTPPAQKATAKRQKPSTYAAKLLARAISTSDAKRSNKPVSVNSGCYTPKGATNLDFYAPSGLKNDSQISDSSYQLRTFPD